MAAAYLPCRGSIRRHSVAAGHLFAFGCLFALGLGAFSAPAAAQNAPAPPQGTSQGTEEPDQVQALTNAFAAGLQRMEQGRPREAAEIFVQILAQNPRLVRVRLELARAYFDYEQYTLSRREFLSVLAGDIPEAVRVNILRFLRAIDSRRGTSWDADFSLIEVGDTIDYDSDEIILFGFLPLTLNSRDGETDYALRYSTSLTSRQVFGANSNAVQFARISADGTQALGGEYDTLILEGQLGLRLVGPLSSLTIAPTFSRQFEDGGLLPYEDRLGAEISYFSRTEQGSSTSYRFQWQDVSHLVSDGRSGHITNLSVVNASPITPTASIGLALSLQDRDASSLNDDHLTTRLTAFGSFDVGRGITLRPNLYVWRRKVTTPSPAVADEIGYGASLSIESSRIVVGNGFTPYIRFGFNHVKSDLPAFSYNEFALSAIGLEKRF